MDFFDTRTAANAEDQSLSLEALGFLKQSYDSLDGLLRNLTHTDGAQPADHAAAVELTVVGRPDVLFPNSHLFL